MRTTNQKTTTEIQAPPAPQPNEGQTASGCGENQAWVNQGPNDKGARKNGRQMYLHQYPDGFCKGEWFWSCALLDNTTIKATGVEPTEEAAIAKCIAASELPREEMMHIAAARQLEVLRDATEELAKMGYEFRTSHEYSKGYDDGYKAALAKLTEFLNIEHKEQ